MTKDEYNQAGKIFEEIEKLESLIRTLQWSIENHERNLKENRYKHNRFIRLLNFTKDYNDEKKATVFFSREFRHTVLRLMLTKSFAN